MSVANFAANLAQANRTFRAVFFQALEFEQAAVDALINLLTMVVPSTGSGEDHNWSDAVPSMQEWTDERAISRLGVQQFTLENLTFANGIEVDRDDLADDKLGLLNPRIQGMAAAAARHKLTLLRALFNLAFTTVHYDGVPLCDNSHPRRDGATQDNFLTPALSATAYQTAVDQLEGITDEAGEFLQNETTHLIVGLDNRWTAKSILQDERLASGATNVNRGTADLLVVKGLTAGFWFVADLSKPLKPFIFQDRMSVNFVAQDRPDQEEPFMRKKLRWGSDYRGNMGNAFWHLIVGSDGTT